MYHTILNGLNIDIKFNDYFCNVKTRVYGLYLGVCMHLLKDGEQLVVMVYQWHCYSNPGSDVKDHQYDLQDNFIS